VSSIIVLDTDVLSKDYKRQLPATLGARLAGRSLCITFVTYGEATQWPLLRGWSPHKRNALMHWLSDITVLPSDRDVARRWGEISARAKQRGRPRPQNDTWIAACCLHYGLPLATLNVKDFQDFADHERLTLITA
jgi:hypothetical protein